MECGGGESRSVGPTTGGTPVTRAEGWGRCGGEGGEEALGGWGLGYEFTVLAGGF